MDTTKRLRLELTDSEILSRLRASLLSRHFPAFRELELSVLGGSVTLTGCVQSYYEKQVALSCCQHVVGVLELVDRIEVDDRPKWPSQPR